MRAEGQEQLQGRAAKEEDDLSELLDLHSGLKGRICQCKSALDLSSRFHLASRQVSVEGRRQYVLLE